MERHTYYPVENLITLKAENNALFSQTLAVTERGHSLCQSAATATETAVTLLARTETTELRDHFEIIAGSIIMCCE